VQLSVATGHVQVTSYHAAPTTHMVSAMADPMPAKAKGSICVNTSFQSALCSGAVELLVDILGNSSATVLSSPLHDSVVSVTDVGNQTVQVRQEKINNQTCI
jgi:hypothetical protein